MSLKACEGITAPMLPVKQETEALRVRCPTCPGFVKQIKVYDERRAFLNNYFNGSVPGKLPEAKDYLSSRKVKLSILPANQKLLDSLLDNCLAGQNLSYVGEDIKMKSKSIDAVKQLYRIFI